MFYVDYSETPPPQLPLEWLTNQMPPQYVLESSFRHPVNKGQRREQRRLLRDLAASR